MEVQESYVVSTAEGTSVSDGYDDIESSRPNVNDVCDETKSSVPSPLHSRKKDYKCVNVLKGSHVMKLLFLI